MQRPDHSSQAQVRSVKGCQLPVTGAVTGAVARSRPPGSCAYHLAGWWPPRCYCKTPDSQITHLQASASDWVLVLVLLLKKIDAIRLSWREVRAIALHLCLLTWRPFGMLSVNINSLTYCYSLDVLLRAQAIRRDRGRLLLREPCRHPVVTRADWQNGE